MTRQLLWLALAMSLLFNVFFLAGYLQARGGAGPDGADDAVSQRVARELGLDAGQAEVFAQLQEGMREDDQAIGQRLALVQQELLELLATPVPDAERLRELVGREAELRRERHEAASRRFNEFLGILTPPQRRQLSEHLHRRGGDERRRRGMLKRFDANQDGRLDDDERAAAREFIDQRHREREEHFRQMRERFDANGDGMLDPEERAAMRQSRAQERPHRRDDAPR